MSKYSFYDAATGEIFSTETSSRPILVHAPGVEVDDATQYVNGGVLVSRPALALGALSFPADGVDRILVDNLPAGTGIQVNGAFQGTSTGADLVFVPIEPGVFNFVLRPPFPWQRAEFTVTVTEVGS